MKRKILFIAVVAMASTLLSACETTTQPKDEVVVYKSANCGCCSGWVKHMRDAGYRVETHNVSNLSAVKRRHNIPVEVETCHTALVGDYVVEGHVPSKTVDRLLANGPALDTIALPGMPPGSPGMPGRKNDVWTIYGVRNGQISVFEKL